MAAAWAALLCCASCHSRGAGLSGQASRGEADRYIKKAVRSSSEGVILLPSRMTNGIYDRARLNDVAQSLREPLAECFLARAISTMQPGIVDGEEVYVHVPEGQLRIRARLSAAGAVLRAELLDSGFSDGVMEACVIGEIQKQRFPPANRANLSYVDVVYWVSLGFNPDAHSASAKLHLRKEQARAGVRGKKCLEGRVPAGTYVVEGLSLIGREGRTLAHRVSGVGVPQKIVPCVSQALKGISLAPQRDSFVRPISPRVEYVVSADGRITTSDERWLRVLTLEETALREERRLELEHELQQREKVDGASPPAAMPWTRGATPPASSDEAGVTPGVVTGGAATPDLQPKIQASPGGGSVRDATVLPGVPGAVGIPDAAGVVVPPATGDAPAPLASLPPRGLKLELRPRRPH